MRPKYLLVLAFAVAGLALAYSTVKHIDRQIGALSARITSEATYFRGALANHSKEISASLAEHQATKAELSKLRASVTHLANLWAAASPADGGHNHTEVRLFMIRSKIAQATNPIILIGDSITEAARLPEKLCGHEIINAGIGGAYSGSYLGLAHRLFDGQTFPMVVVAIGTNDSQKAAVPPPGMKEDYTALVDYLASHSNRMVIVGIPPIDAAGSLAKNYFDADSAEQNNEVVKSVAAEKQIPFVDLRSSMTGENLTVDGVHLSPEGYQQWDASVLNAVQQIMCKSSN